MRLPMEIGFSFRYVDYPIYNLYTQFALSYWSHTELLSAFYGKHSGFSGQMYVEDMLVKGKKTEVHTLHAHSILKMQRFT